MPKGSATRIANFLDHGLDHIGNFVDGLADQLDAILD